MKDLRILVVEDFPIIRYGLRELIEAQRGWKICSEAATGRAALQKVRTLKPEIVLLDLSLPDLPGVEAIPRIVEIHDQTGILVLSDSESGVIVRRVFAAGARGVILKSDSFRDVVRGVQALARGKSFQSRRAAQLMKESSSAETQSGYQFSVTARELQILKLLAEGKTNREVGASLTVSVRTVEAHRASLMRKLELGSLTDLIYFAIRNGIVHI
jgi:DNA-binding NarL/FixJ family response regulator